MQKLQPDALKIILDMIYKIVYYKIIIKIIEDNNKDKEVELLDS